VFLLGAAGPRDLPMNAPVSHPWLTDPPVCVAPMRPLPRGQSTSGVCFLVAA